MKKIKKFLSSKIFIFILGGLVFGTTGVLAVTYFDSKNVTYDNETSGLSSNNVQGAIDELYEECTKGPAPGDTILDSVDVVSSGAGLYKDTYEEGGYFYKGKNVNNYITFNNETWRIVSIEPDKTIKIMREASIGNKAWDSSNSNNWKRPATLNTYLNGSYLTGTLNATAQSQIVPKDWSIGSVTYGNNDLADQINDEKSTTWNGKVALVTASEYIRSNSNQSSCGTFSKINDNFSTCQNSSWMYINDTWWTLSPYAGRFDDVIRVYSNGVVSLNSANNSYTAVRPAVYLSSSVQITGGNGSSSSPYTLG